MTNNLESNIQNLLNETKDLGTSIHKIILEAVEALRSRDTVTSQQIIAEDHKINQAYIELEQKVIFTISTASPNPQQIRLLASILDVASELNRMCDYAKGIAKINILMGEDRLLKPLVDLPRMAEITAEMVEKSITAFVEMDVETAKEIPLLDDLVDDLYNHIYKELINFMVLDQETIEKASYLLWAAHNLERLADRVNSICERTIFVATGVYKDYEVPDMLFD